MCRPLHHLQTEIFSLTIITKKICLSIFKNVTLISHWSENIKSYHEYGIHHYKGPYPRSKYEIK